MDEVNVTYNVKSDKIKSDFTPDQTINRLEQLLHHTERMNEKCEENMRRLNTMMLELKGIVAQVRPQVKKTGWYGDELQVIEKQKTIFVEVKSTNFPEVQPPEIEFVHSKDMLSKCPIID